MKIGLFGLPNSGKTTIFNALTQSDAEVTAYAKAKAAPNIAVITVADERVDRLAEFYSPKKITYPTIEIVDFAGFSEGSAKKGGFSGDQLTAFKSLDAFALVVRNFRDDLTGDPTPLKDLETIETEFILADLIAVESRLEKIRWSCKRGKKTAELEAEERVLKKIEIQLNDTRPIRELAFDGSEKKIISGFQYLSKKPSLVILNSSESAFGKNSGLLGEISEKWRVIEFAGTFEMELSKLSDAEEAMLFMKDMKISDSARDRLTQCSYETLGYISFLTVGADEVRAWTIQQGATAVDAAGSIHSDLARGFIRAECFSYKDFIECGSEKAVKDQGRFRLEGKEYTVNDGDILSIRFSV
ncbi:MAG: redox-regulated ATPase YchF [Syntrophales bacterium]|jgi:GTP-binding protein YchF|nr:redox-regulated ATPase YchF [Syntrophales bacterium]MDY0043593.1 redox-regulated ATPase YchF [Syntrophales bacterium]